MQIRVLGCSGGIGGALRTSSFLLDEDILLDAGTGIGDLSIQDLTKIDHIFLTHSHVDHILGIPLIADTLQGKRIKTIYVYALKETIQSIKQHIFNWELWPDFTVLPSKQSPCITFITIHVGQSVCFNNRTITAIPVDHAVPGVGYLVDSGDASLVYSGDTTSHPPFWAALNQAKHLKYLIIETAFMDKEEALARLAKHYTPKMLCNDLVTLSSTPEVFITHLKPDQESLIMQEFTHHSPLQTIKRLTNGDTLFF